MSKNFKERPRLGRGLSSLLTSPEIDDAGPVETEVGPGERPSEIAVASATSVPAEIPIKLITPNPHQPRRHFEESGLRDLAASLKRTGLIQPVILRKVGEAYQLVAGERRWRAAEMADMQTIPAIIRDVDGLTQSQMALIENTQREDLNPIDRATAYGTLLTQLAITQAELATQLSEDRSVIANHLRLLALAEGVQSQIAEGSLSLGHAKILAGIEDSGEQMRLASVVVRDRLSVRQLEALTKSKPEANDLVKPSTSPHLAEMEKTISRQLGMRVQVRAGAGKTNGKLVIHYGSLDQFDDLVNKLGVTLTE